LLRLIKYSILKEKNAIKAILLDYIEGSTKGQPVRLENAFYKNLNLYYTKDNALKVWSGRDYIKDTKEGKPTGEKGKIVSIDFENDIAVAKAKIWHPKNRYSYIDYFMLVKVKNQWIIIHKSFTRI